jgi:predicted nuclease of restriction endonuclease-like RecB superfamily
LPTSLPSGDLRRKLFSRGPVFQEPDLFHTEIRSDVVSAIAVELESSVEQVEAGLFADRPEEYLLTHPGPSWTPLSLLQRYNLELARGVLYRATLLRIEIHDNFKDVWRYLKLFKIMFWCEEMAGDGYRLTLSGPMSDFILTDRYGIAFAEFMPALLLGDRWRMVAAIKPFPEKIPLDGSQAARQSTDAPLLRYRLDQDCGLHSHYRRAGQYDSQLERTFASEFTDFEEKFGSTRGRWKLGREQEVLVLGGTVMIPDFQLVHSLDKERKILIELVGYWSPNYLRNKVAKVRSANCPYLLLLVYEDLNVTREAFGEVSSEIVFFKQKPVIKEIMPVIEAMAERVYGPLRGKTS